MSLSTIEILALGVAAVVIFKKTGDGVSSVAAALNPVNNNNLIYQATNTLIDVVSDGTNNGDYYLSDTLADWFGVTDKENALLNGVN
jgi:hypothetical protein